MFPDTQPQTDAAWESLYDDAASAYQEARRETVLQASQVCLLLALEIDAKPGSSIHSALVIAADRICELAK